MGEVHYGVGLHVASIRLSPPPTTKGHRDTTSGAHNGSAQPSGKGRGKGEEGVWIESFEECVSVSSVCMEG